MLQSLILEKIKQDSRDLSGILQADSSIRLFPLKTIQKKQSIKTLSKVIAKNAWQGSKVAGRFGAGYGVSDAMANDKDFMDIVKEGAQGYAAGRVLGAGMGFAGGVLPAVVKAGVGA